MATSWCRVIEEAEAPRGIGTSALHELEAALAATPAARSRVPLREVAGAVDASQPHGLEPGFLRACLRAKAYNVRKALDLARNYIDFRRKSGWNIHDGGSQRVTAAASCEQLLTGFNLLLPSPDAEGHAVLTQQMKLLFGGERPAVVRDGSSTTLEAAQRAGFYLLHRALARPSAQTRGLALLLDFRGFDLAALRQIRLADLRRGVRMLQDCVPAKLECIYIVHQPRWIVYLVSLLRPFLRRQDLQQKFVLLGEDYERLHELLGGRGALPAQLEVGGTLEGFESQWAAQVAAWVAEETAWGSEEEAAAATSSSRPVQAPSAEQRASPPPPLPAAAVVGTDAPPVAGAAAIDAAASSAPAAGRGGGPDVLLDVSDDSDAPRPSARPTAASDPRAGRRDMVFDPVALIARGAHVPIA